MTYKGIVNSDDVSGSNHSDFPLYVDLTAIDTLTQSEADSIRVYSDSSLTTELPREIVSTEEMHFKSSSLNGGDEYWVDYDGVRSDYAIDATYGAENVWDSNYKAVWHLNNSGTIVDSTSNDIDELSSDDITKAQTGKIGKAAKGTSESSYIDFGDVFGNLGTDNFAIELWVKESSQDSGDPIYMRQSGSNYYPLMTIERDIRHNDNDHLTFWLRDTSSNNKVKYGEVSGTGTPLGWENDGNWHHVVLRRDNDYLKIFEAGTERASAANDGLDIDLTGEDLHVFNHEGRYRGLVGIIDESRIYIGDLSADWISTEYNNQNDPDSFWTWEEAAEDATVTPTALSLEATLQTPTVSYDWTESVSALNLQTTLHEPTIRVDKTFSATAFSLQTTLHEPTIKAGQIVSVLAFNLGVSLKTPSVSYDWTESVDALNLQATLHEPNISASDTFQATAFNLETDIKEPTIDIGFTFKATAFNLEATLHEPNISVSGTFQATAFNLETDIKEPTIDIGSMFKATAFNLEATLPDPAIHYDFTVFPDALELECKQVLPAISGWLAESRNTTSWTEDDRNEPKRQL